MGDGGGEPDDERARRRVRVGVVAAGVIGVLVAAWIGGARLELRRVDISWAGPTRCTGSSVTAQEVAGWGTVEAVRLTEDMSCRRVIRVANRGRVPVRIERVTLPLLGPDGGAGVQVVRVDGHDSTAGTSMDAVVTERRAVTAGAEVLLEVQLRYRPGGCTAPGSITYFDHDASRIELSTVGRHTVPGNGLALGFRGTADTDCDA